MGALIISLLNTHFDWENMGASGGEFYSKMALFPRLFTLSVSSLLLALLRFFSKFFLKVSFGNGERSGMNNSCRSPNPLSEETNQMVLNNNLVETEALPGKVDCCSASLVSEETNQMVSNNPVEPEALPERADSEISKSDGDSELGDADGAEASKPSFVFKFEYQTREILSRSNKEYEFLADKLNLFKEEGPEFTSSSSSRKYEFKAEENVSCFVEEAKVATFTVEEGGDHEEIAHEFSGGECEEDEESDKKSAMEDARSDEELMGSLESDSDCEEVDSHEVNFLSEKDFGSPSLGFLSAEDFGERDELPNFDMGYESDCFEEEDDDINEQIRELQELPSSSNPVGLSRKDEKPIEGSENAEKPDVRNSVTNDSEDSNTLETLWEHQELMEQLKMELKKVRATGLPTILEESESPNMDDLKPWKIDEKAHQGDRMGELQTFHRIYRERMRKFDILNYQKLYAIGFLQSKDPLQSFPSSSKSSAPAIPSFLSQNFWRCKPKNDSDSDPMVKFIRELHSDLEVVYVGQLCLSWEILQWQYEKALNLWDSAPYGMGSYNVVAGEFQQFQVHLVRFVENECFQGPRVENYVKNRCVMRHLLQVPGPMLHYSKERMVEGDEANASNVIHVHKICIDWAPQVYFEGENVKRLKAEVLRGAKLKCTKCGLKGAALGCFVKSCRRSYHVTCAIEISKCRWDKENFLLLCPAHCSTKFPSEKSNYGKPKICPPPNSVEVPDKVNQWIMCPSGLSSEEKLLLIKFAEKIGATVSRTWRPDVTHVIAALDGDGAYVRTFKTCMAILAGRWILKIDWVKACMEATDHLNEEPYEVSLDNYGCCDGPKTGRLRATNNDPKLFNGLSFYFAGDFVLDRKEDLQDLIIAAGGTVFNSSEEVLERSCLEQTASRTLVVYNLDPPEGCKLGEEVSILWQRSNEAQDIAAKIGSQIIGHTWLLESIARCKLQPFVC